MCNDQTEMFWKLEFSSEFVAIIKRVIFGHLLFALVESGVEYLQVKYV